MDENETSRVRQISRRQSEQRQARRAEKRLQAQADKRRSLSLGAVKTPSSLSEADLKGLRVSCKNGKMSLDDLKLMSQAITERDGFAENFMSEDGCLHSLVGLLTGKDGNKQVIALYSLANLAAQKAKPVHIARFAGPYLITNISGSNVQLAELSCTVLANLVTAGDKAAVKVLVNQDIVPSLLLLVATPSDSVQDVAYQTLYHVITQTDLEADALSDISHHVRDKLTVQPPVHLLWVLFSLTSNQMLHSILLQSPHTLQYCLEIATYEIFQKCDSRPLIKVLTPIVRILANLAGGPEAESVCLNLMRYPDFAAIVTALLATNYTSLCQETVWLFANIVNNENVKVQEEFVDLDLMDKLETHVLAAIAKLDPYFLAAWRAKYCAENS